MVAVSRQPSVIFIDEVNYSISKVVVRINSNKGVDLLFLVLVLCAICNQLYVALDLIFGGGEMKLGSKDFIIFKSFHLFHVKATECDDAYWLSSLLIVELRGFMVNNLMSMFSSPIMVKLRSRIWNLVISYCIMTVL